MSIIQRLKLTLLLGAVFTVMLPLSAKSFKGTCGNNLTWRLDDTGHLVISGQGDMKDFGRETPWLPEMVRTLEVQSGIRYIGKNAFAGTNLVTVELPTGVEHIGEGAFKNNRSLASVTLPYGLKIIDKGAFQGCHILPTIHIPSSVYIIGEKAFSDCWTLGSIDIPSRVSSLGKDAFKNCNKLTDITELPDFIYPETAFVYGLKQTAVESYIINSYLDKEEQNKAVQEQSNNIIGNEVWNVDLKNSSLPYGESDVDKPMGYRPQNNRNTFAFIVANEKYAHLSQVPFAHNDGTSFARYCTDVLGLPKDNVNIYHDATWGSMKGAIGYLRDIDEAFKGDINVIFYYAGHGGSSDDTQDTFLVPSDAVKIDKDYCYALNDLYSELSNLKANSVKVFLDACFSGASRDNVMVEKARKVAIVPKKAKVNGNLVVMSAASDDQTAWQYNSQGHGLFTYYLLKKLRETSGNVSLGELFDYIDTNVKQTSVVVNRKKQNPSVLASKTIGDSWRTWTIK